MLGSEVCFWGLLGLRLRGLGFHGSDVLSLVRWLEGLGIEVSWLRRLLLLLCLMFSALRVEVILGAGWVGRKYYQ